MRTRDVGLAVAAGLALADASVVTLALPELLVDLDTTVPGVAAVIGAYTVALAAALIPLERLQRRVGPARVGGAGFAVFALACLACARADSLTVLLVARAVQAVGGAAGLIAVFALLVGHADEGRARGLWLGTAVVSTAVGPALGGALTEAFSWPAIFVAQAPVAALAAVLCLGSAGRPAPAPGASEPFGEADAPDRVRWRPAVALALVSAALTAVLFLLVLLLVAGWAVSPLAAAAAVTVLPAAALAGSRVGGPAVWRAVTGAALLGLGTLALAALPSASVAWTFLPQVLAGAGMGLALPALGGELLPERDTRDAAVLLTVRHVGIAVALAVLAPVTAARLDDATQRARERGVALVLDARLAPERKLDLAPALLAGVDEDQPRAGLRDAAAEQRGAIPAAERGTYDRLTDRADDVLVEAVGESFRLAFVLTGLCALLGGAVLARIRRPPWAVLAALGAGALVLLGQVGAFRSQRPEPVALRDPCAKRPLPSTGGVNGFLQDRALQLLDRDACNLGSSREELVLALADEDDARAFEQAHGVDPRSVGGLLGGLLG